MGKQQFRLRLSRKSGRDLNPVEKWRRKQKDNQKLRRIVSRLSQDARPPQRPRPHRDEQEAGRMDPMLGELLTTTQLRGREESSEGEDSPGSEPVASEVVLREVKSEAIQLIPTSVLAPRAVPDKSTPSQSDEDEDLDSLALSTFETQVAKPTAQTAIVSQQAQFQRLLEDPDMADFYKTVGDFL